MAHRILVPLDGSPLAERAIPWADAWAGALAASVEIVEVLPLSLNWQDQLDDPERTETDSIRRARGQFPHATTVNAVVLHGSPSDVIAAHARVVDASLIVMASHGRTGLTRALLGSVTADVIRQSSAPVLVVHADTDTAARPPTRVLVPLDPSGEAETVLPPLAALGAGLGWTYVLCSVADSPPPVLPVQGAVIPLGSMERVDTPAEVTTYLERLADTLRKDGIQSEIRVGLGDAADVIVETAAESAVDLIAMSTHARRGVDRWVIGSVTEAVIAHARVPVLTVHRQPPAGHGNG